MSADLMIGQSKRAGDVPLSGSMHLVSPAESVLAHVVALRAEAEPCPRGRRGSRRRRCRHRARGDQEGQEGRGSRAREGQEEVVCPWCWWRGLGNPGEQYALTPHNLGFMVVDRLAERHAIRVNRRDSKALVGLGEIAGRSGDAGQAADLHESERHVAGAAGRETSVLRRRN